MVKSISPDDLKRMEAGIKPSTEAISREAPEGIPEHLLTKSKFNDPNYVITPTSQMKTSKITEVSSMASVKTVSTRAPGSPEEDWTRSDFPSNGILYKEDVFIRPLKTGILKKLTAARASESFTMMLDALQYCINIDIRDLTVPDLYFFMYWLRLNSYPRSPMTIEWTSKYGNKNVTRISGGMSTFEIVELKMTKHELEHWRDLGITIPTVRDMEALQNPDLAIEDKWEIQYSQYMYISDAIDENYINKKIEAFNNAGPDVISDIDKFSDLISHGVIEQIKVKDVHFDLKSAVDAVQSEIDRLGLILDSLNKTKEESSDTTVAILAVLKQLEDRQKLLEQLKTAVDNNETVTPDDEVVDIGSANINLLFP